MEWTTRTDVALLAIAGYVAVMSLVRMMQRRHDEVVDDVKRQVAEHKRRPKKRPVAAEGKGRDAA
jgi:hypothetical protein